MPNGTFPPGIPQIKAPKGGEKNPRAIPRPARLENLTDFWPINGN
ncbi:hypothetical protein ICHJ_P120 (plasmid) [Fluviibacter phosphoraccumulans]|uniref:Uncharacterized protein n=1 Tax=Fluviibacter phosphoraccumulans TaxID=1751046 RepID=A0A7R6TNY6_9RHOO|nr:hypothetical protein ICHIAU1_P090 [Fluviibacter phosphoraccumulans]BBU72476.1 hypothetical protein ICHJ_P120 [Fluviibacter phosphoraccumulans]